VDGAARLARHPNLIEPRTPIAPSGEQIELAYGDQRVVVVEVGAGLRSYFADDRAVVDGYEADEIATSGRGQLLIPWPNRIEDGSYEFEGVRQQLPLDEPERQNAIHGLVRWSAWRIAEREPGRAALEHLLHPRPGYLFSLALRVEYTLSDEGLTVLTEATNLGSETAPYGSGAHPYLAIGGGRVDGAMLRVPARTALEANERGIPVGSALVEGTELDFRATRAIGATKLDHAFTDLERGSDGLARVELTADGRQATLWADESYPYLMVFTGDTLPDGGRRSLAVEPMTCAPNAFRSGDGLVRLEPEQTHTGSWGIAPVAGLVG
jgi:aldose 1-epimerase